jgi:hypothetical protein
MMFEVRFMLCFENCGSRINVYTSCAYGNNTKSYIKGHFVSNFWEADAHTSAGIPMN